MKHFRFYNKADILSLTKVRKFETRLGERISYLKPDDEWPEVLANVPSKYILLGIPEDIGVKANLGIGGADTTWLPFLNAFLNVQSNEFLSGEEIMLLGNFDFGDLKYLIENNAYNHEELLDAYRHAVNTIDDEVEAIVKLIAASGKIPIVIGGGHNNAYPLIKGVSKGLHKAGIIPNAKLNVINVDSHADFKTMEGRHSGNAFRYADTDGYLNKYCAIGVHENYIPNNVLSDMHQHDRIRMFTYEDVFIREKMNFIQAVAQATGFTEDIHTGLELDVDVIENVLSSACTPSGISVLHARQYINYAATDAKVAYLHICEGACQLSNGSRNEHTGKLISYLVTDFVKAMQQ